jgi:hypothetical protein
MKFNREYLEELTLQKIKEVNDEAGYRKYLEVPEMVEIVASIIEKQVNPHDGSTLNSFFLEEAELKIKNLKEELEDIEQILGKALKYPWFKDDPKNFPTATEEDGVCVGDHTAWSLAMCAADKIKELEEELAKWKACADMLFVYADELKCGTHNRALYESVCEDIKKYENLKK